jgi:TRAP-type C4-dicarboxylate transport system permease small subunit
MRIIERVTEISHILGQSIAILMMFLVAADVFMRYIFGQSIAGALEVTELMMVLIVFWAIPYVELKEGHVRVELAISRFPPKIRWGAECVGTILGIGIFSLWVWQSFIRSLFLWQKGDVSGYLRSPISPFLLVITFGCVMTWFQLVLKLLRIMAKRKGDREWAR